MQIPEKDVCEAGAAPASAIGARLQEDWNAVFHRIAACAAAAYDNRGFFLSRGLIPFHQRKTPVTDRAYNQL
jgi:hypothetical protein